MNGELPNFTLPTALVSKVDLAKLIREIEAVDSDLETQKVRDVNKQGYHLPAMSTGLSEFIELNKIDLMNDQQRMIFKEQMNILKNKAPIVHLTFASQADPQSLASLVAWLRQEIHPWSLVSVGLQPALIGGVYIRTPNHVHDLSMRALFHGKTDVLVRVLEGLSRAG